MNRVLLAFCAFAVAFAAVDTYVVVLALPDMMASVGISVEQLQRAAPIVSGFLLGYVAALPLIGRIADLRGQVPVVAASLTLFSLGSLLTAVAPELVTMVAGRFLQGMGGGGLVPATMSLVAALYPAERRGVPLGMVSAVQEFGSVLGPLYGALVLSFATWRGIFAINLAVGALLAVAVRLIARDARVPSGAVPSGTARPRSRIDLVGLLLTVAVLAAGLITYLEPSAIKRDLTWGRLFIPYVEDGSRWITPIGVITIVAALLWTGWSWFARAPIVDLRGWLGAAREADLLGAVLLGVALAGVVLAFATADPAVAVFSPQGPWFLAGAALAAVGFVVHLRRADNPVVPRGALRARPAWGSLVVSFLVGWSLIAALVDIPLFARTTIHQDSQLGAALVLLRFLAALPVGAVLGGWLLRHFAAGPVTAVGMVAASGSFAAMTQWEATTLDSFASNLPLVVGGLGFGLALAPVNAAMLASTTGDSHGLASALVVVARMVGMLIGISALTTIGLRRLHQAQADQPDLSLTQLGILQEQAVFAGAAVTAGLAAVLALVLLRDAATRSLPTSEALRSAG
ncbi:MFS transporter [Nocardioides sambongensis]|uniref:MFS transporter n=1 Tax=Nocardioides sambongensis TaxID=2589074 RepID=UPI0011288D8B|nr:MFS transporter [Nocardioides sambongensis]